MSEVAKVKNIGKGVVALGPFGRLAPGDIAEVPAERLKDVCGDGIVEIGPDGHPIDETTIRVRKRAAVSTAPPKDTGNPGNPVDVSGYPDGLSSKQALEIATGYGFGEELKGWLDAGEIEGAARKSDAANSPWVIPKAGLLARITKHKATA